MCSIETLTWVSNGQNSQRAGTESLPHTGRDSKQARSLIAITPGQKDLGRTAQGNILTSSTSEHLGSREGTISRPLKECSVTGPSPYLLSGRGQPKGSGTS
jgi:hypothetical protein